MANTSGSSRTQADKERSKQASRPVTANQASRTDTRGGSRQSQKTASGPRRSEARPSGKQNARASAQRSGAARPSQRRRDRRSPTALLTWGTAALVLVIVVVLVVVKLTGGSTLAGGEPWSPVSSTVANELATVPTSVFNTVGTTSSVAPIYPPIVISGQKPLTFTSAGGTKVPGVFYYGAEYCPHCAAQRWALIVALNRFGTFKGLGNMTSSATDQPPSIATFTFSKSQYTSPYFVFKSEEFYSNQPNAAGTSYTILQRPTPTEARLTNTYDNSKYFPAIQQGYSAFPFVDYGNQILSEENFDPAYIQGFTRDQIAAGLKNPTSSITQAIVASSNYVSASICHIDGQQPATVCTSKGVTAAAKALKLS